MDYLLESSSYRYKMRSSHSLVGPPLITCDDTGLIKSFTSDMGLITSSLITCHGGMGMTFKDPTEPIRGLLVEDLTIDRWPIKDLRNWTTIPDLCYCVKCEIIYCSREDIINHFCPGHAGKSLGKRKYIDELKEEDCDVVEFLSWFLPRVIVDKNPKQFSHRRFTRICRRKLIGAPINCCLGGFMMWLLSNTWCHSIVNQNHFIRKLFESPRQVIDWELYPLSAKKFDHVPPTICIYDVCKKVKDKDVIGKYKNCYDEDYDKVAYHDLKNCYRDDVEVEIERLSGRMAFDVETETAVNKEVAEILSGPQDSISEETAIYILNSCHIFSLEEAKRFLDLFPKSCAKKLNADNKFKYGVVEDIWNIYGPKEDTKCLDLEDPTTYEHFSERIFKFIPIRQQFDHCGRPLKGDKVFEVFSITIRELDPNREFSLIYMKSDASHDTPLIIYKLPEGKQVDIGKPLSLRVGLFRLPSPNFDVVISFTKRNTEEVTWYYVHDALYFERKSMFRRKGENHPYDKVVKTEICMDKSNTSFATVIYRISLSALRAELAFIFICELNELITITDGYIVVTDNGNVGTKRVVKEYCEETPVCLRSGMRLQVDRCVFGVPTGFFLRVAVKLVYFANTSPDTKRVIEGYHDFKMPYCVSTQGLTVPASGGSTARLCVECSWNGDN